ncbi:hypothetical protein GGQ22_13610 [Nocardioides sp. zg-579]|uniref:EccD-like transmembrane domain-containing protein n=1 Tax=Nocardioides marmotae TaxID=2663857 RepID=A0A6I3JDA3_9ACTN|nr:hypothetical protein [Nocardioides marmotae]MCR6032468.1 hypothetical protein [Gordonia jinghuaiqii]MTB96117.1 hypothetical protein [Nocardioides marmotae]QKD99804.1 hypothetical protein HPC71_00865 [Nocardioides marmotae]
MAGGTIDVLALSIHGSVGVVDLVVPAEASARDVAEAYAAQAGLAAVPSLARSTGAPLPPEVALSDAGVDAGTVLVALLPGEVAAAPGGPGDRGRSAPATRQQAGPGRLSVLWFCVSSALAGLAGWFAAQAGPGDLRDAAVALLGAAALVAVLPIGRFAGHRAVAAPAFAGAAAFAVLWDPAPERLPTVVGTSALVAAVAAAVARALDRRSEEALRTWMVVGGAVFLVTVVAALADLPAQVVWAVLLIAAVLAARLVPGWAVDVPDQLLVDIERLAVTAWSAREQQPRGRRGRTVVRPAAVAEVAARGARIITSASVAVLAVAAVAAPLLLATATVPLDRIGARVLVGTAGAALLLAARSYRHVAARSLLRAAGLACEVALLVHLLDHLDGRWGTTIAVAAVGCALLLVVVAVATGRGWRSAWWSRRAEVLEGICGSFAVASVVVAIGLFRVLWERTF